MNINTEEYELLISFKKQLNEKLNDFSNISKEIEIKEKQLIDFANFYNNEKVKNLKQLNVIQEELKKCLTTFTNFEEKI